jgi:threonine dehydrogenase-like Zn-dependent dehydrogenase
MSEHYIHVKALHEMHGGFTVSEIGSSVQMDLDTHSEVSISFTCDCGEKFYKQKKAEEHLKEEA